MNADIGSKPKRRKWVAVCTWLFAGVIALICGLSFTLFWERFHPRNRTPIIGPAGPQYRAFIDDRGFGDIALIVCAADWPYTFFEPFSLGDVYFPQAYSSAKIFWSGDGSVLIFRVTHRGQNVEVYESAYDFREHRPLQYNGARIGALVQARGGLGSQFNEYSERKGDQ